jgi:acetyltransferase-like isoleucine patch superfamily enzyme
VKRSCLRTVRLAVNSSSPRRKPSRMGSTIRRSRLLLNSGVTVGRWVAIDRNVRIRGRDIDIGTHSEILQGSTVETLSTPGEQILIGDNSRIKAYTWICSYGGCIKLGKSVLVGHGCVLFGHGGITIGSRCMLAQYVSVMASNHAYWVGGTLDTRGFTKEPISIGNDVWIGANSVIAGGTTIEDNVVVGAGSVVRGKLPSGFLYGGTPARRLRRLEDDEGRDVQVFHW